MAIGGNPTWQRWLVNPSHPVNTRVTPSTWWGSFQSQIVATL
jgi:hypothetical protein